MLEEISDLNILPECFRGSHLAGGSLFAHPCTRQSSHANGLLISHNCFSYSVLFEVSRFPCLKLQWDISYISGEISS